MLESQRSSGKPRDLRSSHRVHRARARQLRSTHDLRATPFQEKIFKIVSEIRYGETLSYKEVARRAGDERAVRAVGTALGANPLALVIPCHRVVASSGKLHGYAGGVEVKARLLAAEQSGPANGRLF
ncbi:MAG: MGMT family protein [Deltaproteobacteria bacterium]|nr:MGMT family protein [Deltaproteobacteria bacterium]